MDVREQVANKSNCLFSLIRKNEASVLKLIGLHVCIFMVFDTYLYIFLGENNY